MASRLGHPTFLMAFVSWLLAWFDARLNDVVMPILGAGHGRIDPALAFVSLLLAVAEALRSTPGGSPIRTVTVVVFQRDPSKSPQFKDSCETRACPRRSTRTAILGISVETVRTISQMSDPFNLERFTSAQDPVYDEVISELRRGRKAGHWMWFVFPQILGLGGSWMSQAYAISSRAEAEAYLAHPILGPRSIECITACDLRQSLFNTRNPRFR